MDCPVGRRRCGTGVARAPTAQPRARHDQPAACVLMSGRTPASLVPRSDPRSPIRLYDGETEAGEGTQRHGSDRSGRADGGPGEAGDIHPPGTRGTLVWGQFRGLEHDERWVCR